MVSVVVPVFNSEKYIEECVNSILAQTYSDIELLLIDDGSTDNSLEIIKVLSKKNDKIRVFYQENSGPSVARNVGIKNSLGEWIAFVDSDDVLGIRHIEQLIKYSEMMEYERGIIVSQFEIINSANGISTDIKDVNENHTLEIHPINEIYDLFAKYLFNSPCTKLYKRDVLNDNKIIFPVDRCFGEDLIFNIKYFESIKPEKYVILPEVNYFYRSVEGSLSHKYYDNKYEISMEQYRATLEVMDRVNVSENDIRRCKKDQLQYVLYCLDYYLREMPDNIIKRIKKTNFIYNDFGVSQYITNGYGDGIIKDSEKMLYIRNSNYFFVFIIKKIKRICGKKNE